MDDHDKPADPNEVELTEGNKKTPPEKKKPEQLIINVNITFCTHVEWGGVFSWLRPNSASFLLQWEVASD